MYKTRQVDSTILNFKNVERIFYEHKKYMENIKFFHNYSSGFVMFSSLKKIYTITITKTSNNIGVSYPLIISNDIMDRILFLIYLGTI